jgi:hypothetical protein
MKKLFFVELTDTFGGEANYSWVTRRLVRASTLMGAARKMAREAGLSVHRTDDYGDTCRYDSASGATCMFVSYADGDEADKYLHVETI